MYIYVYYVFFFFKQKTAYEMRISDWSSDVCSSDLDYQQDRPGGIRCHSVSGGAGSCNRWRLVGPQALSRLQPWRLQHQQLLGRWQQLWRSEERRGGKECVRTCRTRW